MLLALSALLLALGITAAAPSKAHADEVEYIGKVEYYQSYDENGYREYNEDGSPKKDAAYVTIYSIENASGTVKVPATLDVTVRDASGAETVVSNVSPYRLSFSDDYGARTDWKNSPVTGIDVSLCSSLHALEFGLYSDNKVSALVVGSLGELEGLSVSGDVLSSLTIGQCPALKTLMFNCSNLSLPSGEWAKTLGILSVARAKNFTSFDGGSFPNLTYLYALDGNLSSIDVSKCTKLRGLCLTGNSSLTSLDASKLPVSITDFDCRYCNLQDTDALVARFGEDSVLPQGSGYGDDEGEAQLFTFDAYMANGRLVPGMSVSASLIGAYMPATWEDVEAYESEPEEKYDWSNYKVISSDPDVLSVSLGETEITATAVKKGTATVTVSYSYTGTTGVVYAAEQVIEFAIPEKTNKAVGISCESTIEIPFVEQCVVCGESHQNGYNLFPLTLEGEDSGSKVTGDVSVSVSPGTTSNGTDVATGAFYVNSTDSQGKTFETGFGVSANRVGEQVLTITAENPDGTSVSTTVLVKVVGSTSKPTLNGLDNYTKVLFDQYAGTSSVPVVDYFGEGLFSYDEKSVSESIPYHDSSFIYGCPEMSDCEKNAFSAVSSDSSVASISADDEGVLQIDFHKAGTTNVTITDLWGNGKTCAVTVVDREVEATKLSLSQTKKTIAKDESFDMVSLLSGVDDFNAAAKERAVLWCKSSNGYIAPISWNEAGAFGDAQQATSVLGRNEGMVTISVYVRTSGGTGTLDELEYADSILIGELELTVHTPVPATGISVSSPQAAMKLGDTQKLTATVTPSGSTDSVVWSSSNNDVLTVANDGTVTAVGNGKAIVTATAGDVSAATGEITVTTPVSDVTLDASELVLYVGADASKLTASVQPVTASNQGVTWSSSAEGVATVDENGNVMPVAPGKATVMVATVDGGFTATCAVTVKQKVTGIELDKKTAVITGAGSVELKATVAPDNATNKNVLWSSSDEAVATVDSNGTVTSVGKGTATITATSEDDNQLTSSCEITVNNPVAGIAVSPTELNLVKGNSSRLSAALSGELAGAVDEAVVSWSSDKEAVATVASDGTVTAVKTGQAVVKAQVGESVVATCAVSVTNPAISVALSATEKAVTVGDAGFQLTATVAPADADETTVTWASSNSSVATVDSSGNVKIVSAGQTVITATVGGVSAQCVVAVSAKEVAATSSTSGFAASASATDSETAEKIAALEEESGSLSLIVQAIDDVTQPVKEALEALSAAGSTVAETFDVHFADSQGNEVEIKQGDGMTITVKVKMTDAMRALDPDTLRVCYVADDGTVEEMPTWVEGDLLCFITTHFSNYAVVGQPLAAGGDSEQTPIPLAKGDGSSLASTGDSAAPLAAVVVAFAAFALLMVSRRLRQS